MNNKLGVTIFDEHWADVLKYSLHGNKLDVDDLYKAMLEHVKKEQMNIFGKPAKIPPPPPVHSNQTLTIPQTGQQKVRPAWLEREEWGGIDSPNALLRMLAMRLRLQDSQQFPFDFIMPAKSGEKVVVFLITKGEPTFVEDGADLYPSDALITKLRLIGQ